MKKLLIIFLGIFIVGCATTANYEKILSSWVGAKEIDLIRASRLLRNNKKRIVLSITEYSTPIEWAFKINKKNYLEPIKKSSYKLRSQDIPKKYHDAGAFVGIPVNFFSKKKFDFDKYYIGNIIDKNRVIDIDNISDWKIAEAMYKKI